MHSRNLVLAVLMMVVVGTLGFECDRSAAVCETTLIISHQQTMLHKTAQSVYPANGKLYRYDDVNQTTVIPTEEVITTDGWEDNRLVIVANGSLPGPTIIAYLGQRVKVHVINMLASDSATMHWHGLPMYNTPWMDGTPFVSQCPILPGQSFTYDFYAEPKGTHWYHSHSGNQRTKGLNGAFIIRERTSTAKEHIMTIQDWNHNWDGDMDFQKLGKAHQVVNRQLIPFRFSQDGGMFLPFYVSSVLINGRARFYNETGHDNGAPLSEFIVDAGETYRFRVIHVGVMYPIRIAVDQHPLKVVASDGYDIQPVDAESLIITPGERYDFEIVTNQLAGTSYWIRVETLEHPSAHRSEAVLRYRGADTSQYPSTTRKTCTQNDRCLVVNCPFATYAADTYTDCVTFNQLQASVNDPPPVPVSLDTFKEHFMNFVIAIGRPSVNGIVFKKPVVSALTQPHELGSICDKDDCGEDTICVCTHSISTNHNDVLQLVFLNMGIGGSNAHPIHLHGYSFYVLKMGFPTYNMTTGKMIEPNMDIDCRGNGAQSFCNHATWKNSSWQGNNVPGLNMVNPPRKDTLNIPPGAYAVVRLKANNPGVWMLHCHLQLHLEFGMSMVINSSYGMHPAPPRGFPVCRNFPSTYQEDLPGPTQTTTTATTQQPSASPNVKIVTQIIKEDDVYGTSSFWAMFGVLVAIIMLLCIYIMCQRKNMEEYKRKCKESAVTAKTDNFSKL
ncbi:uncharacterized protein [Argopecten irradians]|uniref:uncharacterized protein n=1 Tax=Argopecten irradians TaxID=31199 RepID=UPI0037167620